MDKSSENDKTEKLAEAIIETYHGGSGINFIDVTNLPVRDKILHIVDLLIELLFPGYTGKRAITTENVKSIIGDIVSHVLAELTGQIELSLRHQCRLEDCPACDCHSMAERVAGNLLGRIPQIRKLLKEDVQAAFDGDPASGSFEEIIISYPYITAIAIHRIAHELYLEQIPLIPRIMSEIAHERTGIDIHPGARIGKRFFIDHATGVVVGETSVIGDNVKFYQGVSLVAVSIPKDARSVCGQKRHPTIEDNVTIYAEATILGDITIGEGSIIGGNVWIRKSVPPGTTVAMAKPESLYRHHKHDKAHKDRHKKHHKGKH
ncbi:MAG: serine O-acetyltransferase EpsC [Planctomycetota bacterium]|jgi:serine O-acetyltransferase